MLALLCGGQGRLSPEMFDLVADRAEAVPIFTEAQLLLGDDPRLLVKHGRSDLLLANHANQLLSVTASLSIHACIKDALPSQLAVTGYSVGEMAAWSIGGAWDSRTALQLTDIRARVMDTAGGVDGQLGYVRGLTRRVLDGLTAANDCAISIINPGNLFVIGGRRAHVTALCQAAETAGAARAALIDVKIASHTKMLKSAVSPFHHALRNIALSDPKSGHLLLAGGDGARIFRTQDAVERLAAQIATPIDWAATLEALAELGVDRVLDLGPGHALADMVSGAFPAMHAYAVDSFKSVDGIRHWITSGD